MVHRFGYFSGLWKMFCTWRHCNKHISSSHCSSHRSSRELPYSRRRPFSKPQMFRMLRTDLRIPGTTDPSTRQILHLRLRECHGRGCGQNVRARGPGYLAQNSVYSKLQGTHILMKSQKYGFFNKTWTFSAPDNFQVWMGETSQSSTLRWKGTNINGCWVMEV